MIIFQFFLEVLQNGKFEKILSNDEEEKRLEKIKVIKNHFLLDEVKIRK